MTDDARRYRRSGGRNVRRTVGKPVRTVLSGTFVFGLLVVLYLVAYRPDARMAAMAANGGEMTLPAFLGLLPSPLLLVPASVIVVLVTAVSSILSDIERDTNPGGGYR